jgi:uncharacterized protein DUF748
MRKALWWSVGILGVLALVIGLVLAFIDEPLRRYAERQLNQVEGYTFRIGMLDLHPIGFSVDLEKVTMFQTEHPDPPIAEIPKWHASIHWRELLTGNLVSDHTIERPRLHINQQQLKKEAKDDVPVEERGWQEAVLAVYPLEINEFAITEADIVYLDTPKAKPLHFSLVNFRAENIRNIKSEERTYPSNVHLDGTAFDVGSVTIDGSADFLSQPHMGVKVDVALQQIKLEDLSPVIGRYNMQLRQGLLSATGHIEYSPYAEIVKLTELTLDGVRFDYVHASATKESEKQVAKKTARAAEKAHKDSELLLQIEKGKILNSEFGFVNKAARPAYRVFLSETNIGLENFSNQLSEGIAYVKLTGKFMGSGLTQASGTFRPEKKSPDFDLNIRMVKSKMQSLNDVLRAYGNFDVAKGAFSFFTEMKVKDGTINGYVKPLFKDLDVYNPAQDKDKGLLQKMYEGIIGGVSDVLENTPRNEVATKADISGPVSNPQASTWDVVVKLIQNAFFQAILPGFEKEVKRA